VESVLLVCDRELFVESEESVFVSFDDANPMFAHESLAGLKIHDEVIHILAGFESESLEILPDVGAIENTVVVPIFPQKS